MKASDLLLLGAAAGVGFMIWRASRKLGTAVDDANQAIFDHVTEPTMTAVGGALDSAGNVIEDLWAHLDQWRGNAPDLSALYQFVEKPSGMRITQSLANAYKINTRNPAGVSWVPLNYDDSRAYAFYVAKAIGAPPPNA